MTLPKTYKHAVFKSAGAPLVIEETPMTPPGPSQILVKVEACGVCFSDMYAQNNIMGGGLYVFPSLVMVQVVHCLCLCLLLVLYVLYIR